MKTIIGQKTIQETLKTQISENALPRFIILVGARGSGRKLIAEKLANDLGAHFIVSDNKIATIKDLIKQSYELTDVSLYLIQDASTLTQASQNALLKVTEEPPNKAYWVLTVENTRQILETLNSRGTVFSMDLYKEGELKEYIEYKHHELVYDSRVINELLDICETPGDIDLMISQGVTDFKKYVNKVIDNIAVVSGSNSFKIGNKLAFKGEEDKYDVYLFMKAFMSECLHRLKGDVGSGTVSTETLKYADGIKITSKYLQDLQVPSYNKSSTFDMWLLEIRDYWMENE